MANEWIDVNERLPEKGKDKKVPECSDMVIAFDGESMFAAFYESGIWIHTDGNEVELWNPITHWQPMPEPPTK